MISLNLVDVGNFPINYFELLEEGIIDLIVNELSLVMDKNNFLWALQGCYNRHFHWSISKSQQLFDIFVASIHQ